MIYGEIPPLVEKYTYKVSFLDNSSLSGDLKDLCDVKGDVNNV